ncbi:unnamed protein product, partial [Arabidopsis halleri]
MMSFFKVCKFFTSRNSGKIGQRLKNIGGKIVERISRKRSHPEVPCKVLDTFAGIIQWEQVRSKC